MNRQQALWLRITHLALTTTPDKLCRPSCLETASACNYCEAMRLMIELEHVAPRTQSLPALWARFDHLWAPVLKLREEHSA